MAEGIVALYHRTDQLKAAIDDLAKFVQDSIKKVEMELAIDELAIMVGETVNEMERNVRAARCGSYNCGPVLSHQLIFFLKKQTGAHAVCPGDGQHGHPPTCPKQHIQGREEGGAPGLHPEGIRTCRHQPNEDLFRHFQGRGPGVRHRGAALRKQPQDEAPQVHKTDSCFCIDSFPGFTIFSCTFGGVFPAFIPLLPITRKPSKNTTNTHSIIRFMHLPVLTKRGWIGIDNNLDFLAISSYGNRRFAGLTKQSLKEDCLYIYGDGEKDRYICDLRK